MPRRRRADRRVDVAADGTVTSATCPPKPATPVLVTPVVGYDANDRAREQKRPTSSWAAGPEAAAAAAASTSRSCSRPGTSWARRAAPTSSWWTGTAPWWSPGAQGLLPGVTWSWLLDRERVATRIVRLDEPLAARAAFLTTAVAGGVVRVAAIGDVEPRRRPAHRGAPAGLAGAVIVILDNRDSFVHNVEHRLAELGAASRVVPSHATRLDEIAALHSDGVMISPGPQGPDEAGISTAAIRTFGRDVPVLGICLGHQCTRPRSACRCGLTRAGVPRPLVADRA